MRSLFYLLLCGFALGGQSSAQAKPWEQAIQEVDARADYLYEEARSRGFGPSWLGTAMNELGIAEHKCAILGRLLERQDLVRDLEEFEVAEPKDDMSEEEVFELLISARMLENWAYTARRVLGFSDDERKATWNLDCVGKFGIPASAYVAETAPEAKFRIEENFLFVLGDIEPGFSEEFAAIIASNPSVNTVAMGSAGGSVYDAIKAGQMIRALGLDTTLVSNCYSACPLVFLGGVRRTIWSPYPTLGFHQMYTTDQGALSPMDPRYRAIGNYVESMGADARFVVASMFAATPRDMFEPELQALCDSRVVTWVQRLCSAMP